MTYEFHLVVEGLDLEADVSTLDALEERVEDMTFASQAGVVSAAVEREAVSLSEAIRTAIRDVESMPGVRVRRLEPDEYVSQAEIAARLGRTRASVSQLISGSRGPGDFPPPAYGSGRVALWRWSAVSRWLDDAGLGEGDDGYSFAVIAAVNAMLEARRALAGLDERDRGSLSELVLATLGARGQVVHHGDVLEPTTDEWPEP